MDFAALSDRLVAMGYSEETAEAKIAHDVVLMAIRDSGFHDNLTVKGGVVMSALTDIARRATMDMDVDFLRYPLTNEAIRRFVSRLDRVAPCKMRIVGKIETLHQQEYKGKRFHLTLTDEAGVTIETKVDIGVHARVGIEQSDRTFRVVVDDGEVSLLANPNEQIFVEKLKSRLFRGLLKNGVLSDPQDAASASRSFRRTRRLRAQARSRRSGCSTLTGTRRRARRA